MTPLSEANLLQKLIASIGLLSVGGLILYPPQREEVTSQPLFDNSGLANGFANTTADTVINHDWIFESGTVLFQWLTLELVVVAGVLCGLYALAGHN